MSNEYLRAMLLACYFGASLSITDFAIDFQYVSGRQLLATLEVSYSPDTNIEPQTFKMLIDVMKLKEESELGKPFGVYKKYGVPMIDNFKVNFKLLNYFYDETLTVENAPPQYFEFFLYSKTQEYNNYDMSTTDEKRFFTKSESINDHFTFIRSIETGYENNLEITIKLISIRKAKILSKKIDGDTNNFFLMVVNPFKNSLIFKGFPKPYMADNHYSEILFSKDTDKVGLIPFAKDRLFTNFGSFWSFKVFDFATLKDLDQIEQTEENNHGKHFEIGLIRTIDETNIPVNILNIQNIVGIMDNNFSIESEMKSAISGPLCEKKGTLCLDLNLKDYNLNHLKSTNCQYQQEKKIDFTFEEPNSHQPIEFERGKQYLVFCLPKEKVKKFYISAKFYANLSCKQFKKLEKHEKSEKTADRSTMFFVFTDGKQTIESIKAMTCQTYLNNRVKQNVVRELRLLIEEEKPLEEEFVLV
jgi:hypothetical protein